MSPWVPRAAGAACVLAALASASSSSSAERRAVTPADTYALKMVSSLDVAPDGSLAFVVETPSRQSDGDVHALYRRPSSGGEPKSITPRGTSDTHPRFSPDGRRLAFLSDPGAGAQLVVADASGGHRKVLTQGAADVEAFDWSPDGRQLVFVRRDPQGRKPDNDPWVITRSQIQRDGEGFTTDRHDHLWLVSVAGGESRRLTSGSFDEADPRWSPDGKWIAFVSNRTADPDGNDNTDVFVVAPGGKDLHAVAANPGPDDAPRWSHRSDRIAFVGGLRPNDFYQTRPLMVAALSGGPVLNLTQALDTWIADDDLTGSGRGGGIWSRDDETLYATLERRGATYLAAIPASGGGVHEILGGRRQVGSVRLCPSKNQFFLTLGDATHLPEIHTMAADGSGLERLSHFNDAFLDGVTLSVPEKLVARNRDGDEVESWLYPPLGLEPSRKYPLILYVHGGPQEYDGDFFDTGLENQVFPGAGYAVLRVNYRGTTSYGEKFCRAIWGDWHSREYEDLMAALDHALAERPWLDAGRLGIGGWSYGGIMTLWTVGHTDRFKVGVPERFSFDYRSIFGEDQWHAQYVEELGNPMTEEEKYRRLSPGTYLSNVKTPLYLIADQKDLNCPLPQVMQAYQRLRLMGQKTELVVYPDEPHSMGRPSHLVDRLERLLRWYGAHLSP